MALFDWLARRRQRDDELQEEIRSHLAMAAEDRIADGTDRASARLAAIKEFGNVTLTTDATRRIWSPWWIEAARDLLNDVRYAVRVLAKSPGFSLIVIAVLALGIGLNAAVFTLFKGLALKPLPGVDGSAQLGVVLAKTSAARTLPLSYPDYQYIRDHDRAFLGFAGSSMAAFSMGLGTRGERVWGEFVTGNYFQLFGVRAQLGRTLLPSDDVAPGRHPVVVVSDGLWRRAFGSYPNIVGKTIHLDAYPLTNVGVADPAFHGAVVSLDMEMFVPIMMQPQLQPPDRLSDVKVPLVFGFGRLVPGTTLATAAAQTTVLSSQLAADTRIDEISQRAMVLPIWRSPYGAQTTCCRRSS
jgi:hypothetical protein